MASSKKILAIIAAMLLLTVIAGVISFRFSLEKKFSKIVKEEQATLDIIVPQIVADLKVLETSTPFPVWDRKQNAESYITPYIGWSGEGAVKPQSDSYALLQALFESNLKWNQDYKSVKRFLNDPRVEKIDTKWIQKILSFDHFDMATNEIVKKELNKIEKTTGVFERISTIGQIPMPNFSDFQKWAVVYLLQQYKAGNPIGGLKVYRHMAFLAHASSTLVSSAIAAKMLADEKLLVEVLKIKNWELVPDKTIQIYKKIIWTWPGLLQSPFFVDFSSSLGEFLKPQLGLCGGAYESVFGSILHLQNFLRPNFVIEPNFSNQLERLQVFHKKVIEICDLKAYAVLTQESSSVSSTFGVDQIPFVRRFYALTMLSISRPKLGTYYIQSAE